MPSIPVPHPEPTPKAQDADTAMLHEQIARLTARVKHLEAQSGALAEPARPQAMPNSEVLLAESQRLAGIGSFALDVAAGQLTWTDQQFRNFGFEPAPAIDRERVITRIHPADIARHEAVVRRGVETGEPFELDYRVVLPDGAVRHLHTIGQPVADANGRVAKVVGTSQDVTERRRLEEQLRAQYDQLKQIDVLKSTFVNSVTHELRTPLASIVGFAEFLEDGTGGPVSARQREFVAQILRGAARLEHLLNDLLDFARIEAGTFSLRKQPAELSELVRKVIESLRPQAEVTGLSLVSRTPDGPLRLSLDIQRIGQVLTNLLDNAIKFSPRGGIISVTSLRRDDTVRCEVRDYGPGIAEEDVPRLFQRFSQLEAGAQLGHGTGLGLSICKALVEAHGGVIGVESLPGFGCTFWFELPLLCAKS